jgi:hypothetical protein
MIAAACLQAGAWGDQQYLMMYCEEQRGGNWTYPLYFSLSAFSDANDGTTTRTLTHTIPGNIYRADRFPGTNKVVMWYNTILKRDKDIVHTPHFLVINLDNLTTFSAVDIPFPVGNVFFEGYFLDGKSLGPSFLAWPLGGKDDKRDPFVYSLRDRKGAAVPRSEIVWEDVRLLGSSKQRSGYGAYFSYTPDPNTQAPVFRKEYPGARVPLFDSESARVLQGHRVRVWKLLCQDERHLVLRGNPPFENGKQVPFFKYSKASNEWRQLVSTTDACIAMMFDDWIVLQEAVSEDKSLPSVRTGDFVFWNRDDDRRVHWKGTPDTEILNMWGDEFCYRQQGALHLARIEKGQVIYGRVLLRLRREMFPRSNVQSAPEEVFQYVHWVYRIQNPDR